MFHLADYIISVTVGVKAYSFTLHFMTFVPFLHSHLANLTILASENHYLGLLSTVHIISAGYNDVLNEEKYMISAKE